VEDCRLRRLSFKISRLYFWVIILVINDVSGQTFNIQGDITTEDLTPVSHAAVTFINQSDTTQRYSAITDTTGYYQLSVTTAIDHLDFNLPSAIELAQNYPNPFSGSTLIQYRVNRPGKVSIRIYNLLGQEVRELKAALHIAGTYSLFWDGKDNYGKYIASGIYFYQLQIGNEVKVKKMLYQSGVQTVNPKMFSDNLLIEKKVMRLINKTTTEKSFTVKIKNTVNTHPQISNREFYGINLLEDTIINFNVNKASNYNMYLYVASLGYDQIYIIDTDSDEIIDTLTGFRCVGNVTPTKSGDKLYITTGSYSVFPYDTTYPATVFSFNNVTKIKKEIFTSRAMICLEPSGVPFIIAECISQDTGLAVDTMRLVGTIDTVTDAISFFDTLDLLRGDLSSARHERFVFNSKEPVFYTFNNQIRLYAYNYQEKRVIRYYSSLNLPYNMVISRDGKYIYCANGPVLDVTNDSIIGWVPGNNESILGSLVQTPDEKYLYLTDPGKYILPEPVPSGHINIFNVKSDWSIAYVGFIDVNKASGRTYTITDRMVIMPDGKKGYVTDSIANIFVLDLEKNEVVNVIRFVPHNIQIRILSLGVRSE